MISETHREIRAQFRSLPRTEREKLLCALIRMNYGTTWTGDRDFLKAFFPPSEHKNFYTGGVVHLMELLTPYSDEPTNPGYKMESSLIRESAANQEITLIHEIPTTTAFDLTTDLPVDYYQTNEVKSD